MEGVIPYLREDMDRRFEDVKAVVRENSSRLELKLDSIRQEQREMHNDHESRLRVLEEWRMTSMGSSGVLRFVGAPLVSAVIAVLVTLIFGLLV